MAIQSKSAQSKTPPTKSRRPNRKSTPQSAKNSGSAGAIKSGTGPGGTLSSSDSASAGASLTDTTKVSKEAQQTVIEGGMFENLVSGLSDWLGGTSEAKKEVPAGTKDQPSSDSKQPILNLGQSELLGTGRNSSPDQVTQLQEMLNAQGGQLEIDGKFGPLTEEAVRNFQDQNGLKIDGLVGPETQGALNGNREEAQTPETEPRPPAVPGELGQLELADPNASPAEQYEHYRSLIEANGGEISTEGATVLGMRGLGTDGQRHDGTSNIGGYDDTFVVLNRDANGNPTVEVFRGATHANQRRSGSSIGPDANGNNVRGVAMLSPGNYSVDPHSRNYQGNRGPSFHVKTQDGQGYVPAFRDVNADGSISASERSQAEQNGYLASAILFHAGTANAPSSIGCQTMPPELMRAFSDAVGFNGFNYTLLDANNSRIPA